MDEQPYDDFVPDGAIDKSGPPYPEPDSRWGAALHGLAFRVLHPRQSAELSWNLAAHQREVDAERSHTRHAARSADLAMRDEAGQHARDLGMRDEAGAADPPGWTARQADREAQ